MGDRIGVRLYGIIVTNISSGQNNLVLKDTLEDRIHMTQDESIGHKSLRILLRFFRMIYYRDLAIESIPTMIWNSFAFSSYMKRQIHID